MEKLKDKYNDVEPESVRKGSDSPIIEDWVSDDEEENVEKKEVKPSIKRINFIKATTYNNPRKTVKNEKIKTAQAKEIANLKKKVKKLERKRRFRTLGMNYSELAARLRAEEQRRKPLTKAQKSPGADTPYLFLWIRRIGGGTGGRVDRGGGRTRGRSGDQGDSRINGQGGQVGSQGSKGNVIRGCTYKEFLACNPKEYDGKGGDIVYTCWIEKMESVEDISGCRDNQKEDFKTLTREKFCLSNEIQKLETELWNHTMVEAGHAAYTDRFHKLDRLLPHLLTPEGKRIERYVYGLTPQIRGMVAATKLKTIQKAMQIDGTLTDEALRNESINKNPKKRENGWEPSKDRNLRDDNKMTRTGNAFATTTNHVKRENTVVPRNVKPSMLETQLLGLVTSVGQGRENQRNRARVRAFMLRAEEARHDSNIMAGIEPGDLGFTYEIEIASR
nr:reverse transcriptase domain-containing protein [Tanacetum cinerariifolium]